LAQLLTTLSIGSGRSGLSFGRRSLGAWRISSIGSGAGMGRGLGGRLRNFLVHSSRSRPVNFFMLSVIGVKTSLL
jgi:hypothetical protein